MAEGKKKREKKQEKKQEGRGGIETMSFRDLYYLTIIAEEGSISKAAERLFMAQASLSQSLRQVEENLGAPVFERSSRGVKPTTAGKVYIKQAEKILNLCREAANEFQDNEEKVTGVVEFGTASFRGRHLIPRALKEYYEKYPQARIHITEQDSNHLEHLVRDGLLDLALTALPGQNLESFDIDSQFRDEILIVTGVGHPIMDKVQAREDGRLWVSLEEAARHEFILSDPNTRLGHIARKTFEEAGFSLKSRNDNITAAFAAAMAREGLGLALTYQSCLISSKEACYLSLGQEGLFLDLALLYPRSTYRSRATLAFARLLREDLERRLKSGEKVE